MCGENNEWLKLRNTTSNGQTFESTENARLDNAVPVGKGEQSIMEKWLVIVNKCESCSLFVCKYDQNFLSLDT